MGDMVMLQKIVSLLTDRGVLGLADSGFRKLRGGRIRNFGYIKDMVDGKVGLEIGGPSKSIFGKLVPVYRHAASVDNCNFAADTIWEAAIVAGGTFKYNDRRRAGRQN